MANTNPKWPFGRSSRIPRSPPPEPDDSTILDPNASSCRLCDDKDTIEMVECEQCKGWYHFHCVGVNSSVSSARWICQTCRERVVDKGRSSTSSKRRSILQLERLAKEKAIHDKLIKEKAELADKLIKEKAELAKQQAAIDAEYLQKEYDIRDNMSESDTDALGGEETEKIDYINDWLTKIPKTDLSQSLPTLASKDTFQRLNLSLRDTIQPRDEPTADGLTLIPPKHVQFAHPLINKPWNKFVENTSQLARDQTDLVNTDPQPTASSQGQPNPFTSEMNFESDASQVMQPSDVVDQNATWFDHTRTTGPTNLGPMSSAFDLMYQQQIPNLIQPPLVPISAQQPPVPVSGQQSSVPISAQQHFVPISIQPTFVPTSTQIPFVPTSIQTPLVSTPTQQPFVPISTYQPSASVPISVQHQQFVPFSVQRQYSVPISTQRGFSTPISSEQRPIVTTSVPRPPWIPISGQHQTSVPISDHQSGTNSNSYQTVVPTSTIQLPQATLNSGQQQYSLPVSIYQQPITSAMANQQQFVPNAAQPSMYGFNSMSQTFPSAAVNLGSLNSGGLGQIQQAPSNPWMNYDPQLNSQQLPPTRLQLAARQTMPKDYPEFSGNPEKWSIFYNAYVNNTTTCGLSNGENLSRLEKCLKDPARKAVQNLLTRPEAVPDIIETLKMLYGRPEASIESQLSVIENEPAPKMHKMETFIDFAMSVRNVTSEIQKTGMWQYLWNPKLMHQLIEKLPYQMRMEWGQIKISTPNVNLSNFSDWLFLRAQTACAVTLPSITANKSNSNSNSGGHVNAHSKSNNSGKKNPNESQNRPTNPNLKTCNACNGKNHDIYECRKFLGMSLNERWETVKSNNLCRICLDRHHALRCESKLLCGESGCTIKHHRLLHNSTKTSQIVTTTTKNGSNKESVHSAHQQSKIVILRRYIPVILYGPNGPFNVIAFLDEGSDMTLIENRVAQKLGLTGTPADLYLEWTAKIVRKEPNSRSVSFKISGTKSMHKQYDIKDARTVKSLDLPSQTVNVDELRNTFKFLRRIPIESYTNETPKILIGLRDCKLSTPRKTRSGEWDDPIATKTLLGWEIHGSNAPSAKVTNVNFHTSNEMNDDNSLHQMVAQFFSLENFGVKKPEQTVEALFDKRARQLLEQTTKRIGDKFETGLLWKYDNVSLPDSLPMAKRRLVSLEKRLQRDPDLALKFRTKFHEYVEKGYVRKLTSNEEAETNGRTWYLPLFPVTYPKKPGKIRLVWDAAAKVSNISLNSMLLSGPDLLVSLPGVLYRFREGAYVVTGDIREMFHQVSIRKVDQMSQRFLWRDEGSSEIDVYVLQVMSFGATCSPSSAQYVKNYNALQFVERYPKAEIAIRLNTYVDDWLQSFDTEVEAENVANEVRDVYSKGGFEIRNWLSNSPKIVSNLGANPDVEQKLSLGLDDSQTERILGMWWDVKEDAFTYSLRYNSINKEILMNNRRPTKREALRTLMSIYDPLGFLASYLVHLKMILQDIWRTGIGWDEQIKEHDDDNLYNRWQDWIKHLPEIEHIRIKRHYSDKINSTNPPKIELHIFVDASELAYATVAYFRIEDKDGAKCSLIGGKTKVAPLKPLSVPRMELQAAVLGARFKNSILENHTLRIERTVIWSDSSTVISWLRSDLRKYNQYVGARVGEILETTLLPEWRWIPSKMNPADDATKWKNSFSLDMNSRWFKGPDFLLQAENFWPTKEAEIEETQEELRPKYVHTHIKAEVYELPIKFEKMLQWKRTMAFTYRFINNVKARLGKPGFVTRTGILTRIEFQEGENALYRKAQLDEFSTEIHTLEEQRNSNGRSKSVEKTSSLYRYSPYLDQKGVLRMQGRIDAISNISLDQKRPILLPTKHQVTDMVVKEYHLRYKHQNTETVINEIKQKFMIPRLRALLKRIRRTCQHCKNAAAQPKPPKMAQLPIGRLASFTRPYTYVGVDYAGPLMITQFRRSVKRWIVVFTCLTIRGVYIDCVESLTTDSCIMAITRFIARNGTPREFFSDRGTNFVGADNELTREVANIDHDLLSVKFTTYYTQWNFNPPYGQHMGGAWERLIGSMKKTLDKILPKSHYPNHETLVTALVEVENIINSRPLTFVSIEQDDQEALTPNHFIKGSSNGNKPPGIFPPPPATLRKNWQYSQQIANEFWNKWVKEYLPMITRRTKWFDEVKPIQVGDQVIIVDENAPRNMWDRGVVIEATKTGQDDRISQVKVRTTNGIYTRPVSKLAVLDLEGPEAKTLTRESSAEGSVTASNDREVAVAYSSH